MSTVVSVTRVEINVKADGKANVDEIKVTFKGEENDAKNKSQENMRAKKKTMMEKGLDTATTKQLACDKKWRQPRVQHVQEPARRMGQMQRMRHPRMAK